MINPSLSVSQFVNVSGSLNSPIAASQNTSTLLILGNSTVIDVVTRLRQYSSATAVATDFGDEAPETLAAIPWFSQTPQPTTLLIGRWAQQASSGQLYGAPLTAAQQLISNWTTITDGGFDVTIDGTAETITTLNFSAAGNLNAVAAIIQTALQVVKPGSTCVWNSNYSQFIITSGTTGATSIVGFLTAPAGGVTDIGGLLGMKSTSNGTYQANGIAAETALAAATLFDAQFGQQWYAMSIAGAVDADHTAVSAFLAASANKHFYQVNTQETGILNSNDTTDIAYLLMNGNIGKTAVQFSSSSPYAGNSMMAKILTVNWGGSNTTIALAYQSEPGITGENLNTTQFSSMVAKNCNGYLNLSNGSSIIWPGICSNGQWIDAVIGADVLMIQLQTDVFALLASGSKVGQDDPGMHQIKTTMENRLAKWVTNGFIAQGLPWNQPGFGSLNQGDTLSKGYYIYQPPIAGQDESTRSQRVSVPFQIAVKLKGAVGTVDVTINFQN